MITEENLLSTLKRAREEAGFTQKEVEARLEMRALTMRDYEVGRLKLPLTVAMELAHLYDITLEQLVGAVPLPSQGSSQLFLANFTSIFAGSTYQLIFLDPVLRAYYEDRHNDFFDQSLFDVLTHSLNGKDKKNLLNEIGKLLFALASADGKISDTEIRTIKYILTHFQMAKAYKEVSKTQESYSLKNLPHYMEAIEVRHFLVWLQFLFASVNPVISAEELQFIESRAEELRVNKSNFLTIRRHFVKGVVE